MKRTIWVLLIAAMTMAAGTKASAQYADLARKGTSLYSGTEKLTTGQMQALFDSTGGAVTYDAWRSASRGFNAGKGLLISFGALTGAGLLTTGIGAVGLMVEGVAVGIGTAMFAPLAVASGNDLGLDYDSKFAGVAVAGVCIVGAGLACMIAGTTVYCIYKKKLNDMTETCGRHASSVSLSFGPQKYGTGFALTF